MKKTIYFSALLLMGLISWTGCSKKDDDGDSNSYSNLTVEENKQNLEEQGVTLVSNLNGMSDMKAVHAAQAFMNLMNNSSGMAAPKQFMSAIANLANDPRAALKAVSSQTQIQQEFANAAGIYNWSSNAGEFVLEKASTTEITYKFPSEGSTTNDLSFTIDNLVTATATKINDADYELLKSVSVTLKEKGTAILTFNMTGSYNTNEEPTSLTEALEFIEGYVIKNTIKNDGSKVSIEQSFKKGDTNIITYYFEVDGKINYTNISEDTAQDDSEDNSGIMNQDVVNKTLAYITIGNIKVEGKINIASLLSNMKEKEIFYFNEFETKTDADQMVAIMNNNVELAVKYNDSGDIICKCDFYSLEKTEEGYYENGNGWSYGEYSFYTVNMNMLFADGSIFDESTFNTDFEEFMNDVKELVTQINNNYETDITVE